MAIKNKVQLITYADSLGGDLKTLRKLLNDQFSGLFTGGVHILPPFPSSADRGFAPMNYFEIDPAFGSWDDMKEIGKSHDIIVDVMVNHISRQSPYFKDFQKHGRESEYADFFITLDKIWPDGNPPREDVAKIFLRKPENPFSQVTIEKTGQVETVWTSFGSREWSEQIDLDVNHPKTRQFFIDVFKHMSAHGVRMVRLDAIGYVIKKPGTSCFYVEPEIYDFLHWIQAEAAAVGIELLPEVHAHYSIQFKLAEHGWVYDFVLPGLILFTLLTGNSAKLQEYLKVCPRKQITTLDCHDGIPVQPDLDDVLEIDESQEMVQICMERGANLNRILSEEHKRRADFDAHQINITYYSALNENDDAYLAARAIQFFSPGVPQVYYVGLLAGKNDQHEVERTGERRAINRHNYSIDEINLDLKRPVVNRLSALIKFRNECPAFDGHFNVVESNPNQLTLEWANDDVKCSLHVDLKRYESFIEYQTKPGNTVTINI